MAGGVAARGATEYCRQFATYALLSLSQLVRPASHSRRAVAARRLSRHWLFLVVGCGAAIVILMFAVDVFAINLMPSRSSPDLWPVRVFTDFAKAEYILWTLGLALLTIAAVAPLFAGTSRAILTSIGLRLQFLFLAVAAPNLVGEFIKGIVGRGRPFVGGSANAFNFSPFEWTEKFASFPSGHTITAFSLAFAVIAVWPRARYVMIGYALLIAVSRVLLLAHHPSDVLAGALVGLLGAMSVRRWFAARRLGFAIQDDGRIVSRPGPSFGSLKGVAAKAFAP